MSKQRIPASIKKQVRLRAKGFCEYCQCDSSIAAQPFPVDHIDPFGDDDLENLAQACGGCNGSKYNKTHAIDPLTKERVPLFHPRRQQWTAHFAWNEDFSLIVGLTATGRATLHALKFNRKTVVKRRAVLFLIGEHPPGHSLI